MAAASGTASPSLKSLPGTPSRNSIDVHSPARSVATPTGPTGARRNRTALRDFYGLKSPAAPNDAASIASLSTIDEPIVKKRDLDEPSFNAEEYVQKLLQTEKLEELMRLESELLSEIKSLDGEKKALVYDNYSKLITATDTIRQMRTNMDPLAPAKSGFEPAVAQLSTILTALSASTVLTQADKKAKTDQSVDSKRPLEHRKLVRWVLDTPNRIRNALKSGGIDAANPVWAEVEPILDSWKDVAGVSELRARCSALLEDEKQKKG